MILNGTSISGKVLVKFRTCSSSNRLYLAMFFAFAKIFVKGLNLLQLNSSLRKITTSFFLLIFIGDSKLSFNVRTFLWCIISMKMKRSPVEGMPVTLVISDKPKTIIKIRTCIGRKCQDIRIKEYSNAWWWAMKSNAYFPCSCAAPWYFFPVLLESITNKRCFLSKASFRPLS